MDTSPENAPPTPDPTPAPPSDPPTPTEPNADNDELSTKVNQVIDTVAGLTATVTALVDKMSGGNDPSPSTTRPWTAWGSGKR